MYNENIQLDVLLSKNITVDLSNEFRNKLEASMGKAIIRKQVSLYNLLNIQWVAIALFTLLGAVTYYFADIESMEQSQLLSQFFHILEMIRSIYSILLLFPYCY